jgi:hypothetical protein
MEPALALATATWVGLLIYGAWLCIEDLRGSLKDEDAVQRPGKTEEQAEEKTEEKADPAEAVRA